jgi:hypothetical protein
VLVKSLAKRAPSFGAAELQRGAASNGMKLFCQKLFLISLLVSSFSCDVESERLTDAKKYVASRSDLKPEMKDAIIRGESLVGMSPEEVIAASGAGQWSILILKKDPVWPKESNPNDVVYVQHENPDSSIFRLDFANKTQFKTNDPFVFSVCFKQGRAFRITKSLTDYCDSGYKPN